ncbi:hypothetical protein BJY04DRAFT_220810 [Aspergillus karnatakaensis]|uniref:uncharacterized protein n=1 Tax=Aspergillus karnatakaensis TaxID=1810916 RepID=UPI003CCCD4CB
MAKHTTQEGSNGPPTFKAQGNDMTWAAVVDFYRDNAQIKLDFKPRQVIDMIYGTGPPSTTRFNPYSSLDWVENEMCDLDFSVRPPEVFAAMHQAKQRHYLASRLHHHTLRWFQLPINHMGRVEDLMVRISRDRGLSNKDHRPLAQFVRESWLQLPAGGEKHYMKPQCVNELLKRGAATSSNTRTPTPQEVEQQQPPTADSGRARIESWNVSQLTAIYVRTLIVPSSPAMILAHALQMPYLSWLQGPSEPHQGPSTWEEYIMDEGDIVHQPMTLNQYYYTSLPDTNERDKDQVITRYALRLQKNERQPVANRSTRTIGLHASERTLPLLIVDQIWLWILDSKTIITSTTKIDSAEGMGRGFFQHVHNKLDTYERESSISPQDVAELILCTALDNFKDRQILVGGTKRSPLEIFRNSIRLAVKCIRFVSLAKIPSVIGIGAIGKPEALYQEGIDNNQVNEYDDISPEIRLLKEVNDICDELYILKRLVDDQEHVWNQASQVLRTDHITFASDTLTEIKKEIMGMIHEAEILQKSIDTLMDLKQKQANVTEAKFARQQAKDTAKQTEAMKRQSDTLVVFTVVTIVFLPLSFLTSLFALNISNFPHKGDDVVYQGWWIFPILFGVSTVVSGFFISIAFQVDSLKKIVDKIVVWRSSKSAADEERGQAKKRS